MKKGPYTANTPAVIDIANDGQSPVVGFFNISVSFIDSSGSPADTVTGSMDLDARVFGADKSVDSQSPLDLSAEDRNFKPFYQHLGSLTLTPTGMTAGQEYFVTVTVDTARFVI